MSIEDKTLRAFEDRKNMNKKQLYSDKQHVNEEWMRRMKPGPRFTNNLRIVDPSSAKLDGSSLQMGKGTGRDPFPPIPERNLLLTF